MNRNQLTRTLLGAFALASLTQTLSAAVVPIDQKTALQGKVTPADTPGFPITISQPGSYRLVSNITVPDAATTAIEITADNVTLDLNGFTIAGPNVCTPNPIRCSFTGGGIGILAVAPTGVVSPANVRIMNGVVRGMGGHGIRMLGDATIIQNVVATNNGGPGLVVGEGSVIDSTAKLNGSGSAIIGLIVRGSIASQNIFGISIRPGGIASGNVATGNAAVGMSLSNGTAAGNTTNNNGTYGIDATCPGVLAGNTAHNTTPGNIRTTGACTITGNTP
jgi:hypothetical protein